MPVVYWLNKKCELIVEASANAQEDLVRLSRGPQYYRLSETPSTGNLSVLGQSGHEESPPVGKRSVLVVWRANCRGGLLYRGAYKRRHLARDLQLQRMEPLEAGRRCRYLQREAPPELCNAWAASSYVVCRRNAR